MGKKSQFEVEDMSSTRVMLFVIAGVLAILACGLIYFLGLAWLLSVLASLTFPQATGMALLVTGSTLLVAARIPGFDVPLVLIGLLVSALLAVGEVLLARLIGWLTPLSVWEAALLIGATAALAIYLISQVVANAGLDSDEDDYLDDDEFKNTVHRLSPDMYVLKPRFDEQSTPKRRRTSRRRSKRKTDESDSD
ncbi:MAG: hypothetical protein KF753_20440 [Caldilineaceae bacterium]|nr:hypothetical protein [Caldilineaceae bacterium]